MNFIYSRLGTINWELKALALTDTGFSLISAGFTAFDGRLYLGYDETNYIGVKVGLVNLELLCFNFESDNIKLILIDAQATAFSIGAYSKYVDAELLLFSFGATIKWEDNGITIWIWFKNYNKVLVI